MACTMYPGMPVGQFGIRPGPMMASADFVTIDIEGRGGHAARPAFRDRYGLGRRADRQQHPVACVAQHRSAEIGGGVDLHVSRRHDRQRHSRRPRKLRGTARSLSPDVRDLIGRSVCTRLSEGTAKVSWCDGES